MAEVQQHSPAPGAGLILVTHLLETSVEYVQRLAESFALIAVIPVPYSLSAAAALELHQRGIPVRTVESITEIAPAVLAAARSHGGHMVVQEVGGYCAEITEDLAQAGVSAIVEDTNQGLWRYQAVADRRVPIYTIADSPLKRLEDRRVGDGVAHSVDALFRSELNRLVGNQTVGVLGYGGIGRYTAQGLKRMGARVHVYDLDPIASAGAATDGFEVHGRTRLLRSCNVIVGVSGHRSLTVADFELLNDDTVLASGSSKQVEFPVEDLDAGGRIERVSKYLAQIVLDGKHTWLLNEGRPVNFVHNSILGNTLDLVYTELFALTVAAAYGVQNGGPDGINRLPTDRQRNFAARWCHLYGGKNVLDTRRS
ncbi:NAD(P)-dependent oxidoreductase [Nocardia sp. NPDC006044]|uniref:NAD(P)-dependent oxidoreductase n=1 Tax=Nocardia sp. NPDC006044 TaxID=3364306 RepID=UPI0036874789